MSTTTGTTATRRQQQQLRWHPPPPPTQRILHFPRRPRRKMSKTTATVKPIFHELRRHQRGKKLEALFDEERSFSKDVPIVLLNAGGECVRRERESLKKIVRRFKREKGVLWRGERGRLRWRF
ncbi:hypothetical protein L1049_018433 [Liquidambar formosana]|uniref:Uncharacterized protein n=1 Tax=Liquidambar formosana TaxID=63359 RepID=A0AAP0WLY3_LIQFO